MKKFLSFIGIIASVLCGNSARGGTPCPQGCFCMNNGETRNSGGAGICTFYKARPFTAADGCVQVTYGNIRIYSDACSGVDPAPDYYFSEFSEYYYSIQGFYGFINGEFIYFYDDQAFQEHNHREMFPCPYTYPHSAEGAKALTDCFRYSENGTKIYYGAGQTINCAPGTYLPANATSCSNCDASKNQICAGGSFERSETIQGLRVNCNPGQYLPANAIQCSACDDGKYSCSGGIYEFNATVNQGLNTQHDGWINAAKSNGGLHNYVTCNPGQYMPATVNTCTACAGDYACPGGIFYTDATYTQDRGRILCAYGTANSNHTACVAQSTLPSFMKNKILKNNTNDTPVASNTNIQPSTGTTTTIQPTTTSITAQNISLPLTTAEKKFDFGNLVSPFADRSATQQKRQPVQTTHGRATRITPQIKKTTIQPQSAQQSPAHRSNNNPHRPSPRQ